MAALLQSGLSALIPKDSRLTFTILVAGTGALALFLEYYYRDRLKSGFSKKKLPEVESKIDSGNEKLEEAIRYYESALVEMQRVGADQSQRMQIRAMLLRAYEIQAILSPDEFNMRSSVMIEGAPSAVMNEIIEENLTELDAGLDLPELECGSSMTLTQLPPPTSSRVRSDSLSSAALSDFYEAFDFLNEEDNIIDDSAPAFYKDQMFLHKVKEFKCRKNRFQQFNLSSPSEYLVKVQCLRLAFDRLMKIPERRTWMKEVGRRNTEKLLEVAGADSATFCQAYDDMMEYVGDVSNLQSIKEELKARRVATVNLFDVVIDFCLLDSFDDLDMPPASITSVIGNSWISQSLRKSMLSTAVWGMVSAKSKKARPDGFLSRFYTIMGVLSPSLAWGFLGDDKVLKPICASLREDITNILSKAFDENQTDYSSLQSLSEALFKLLEISANQLSEQLNNAVLL